MMPGLLFFLTKYSQGISTMAQSSPLPAPAAPSSPRVIKPFYLLLALVALTLAGLIVVHEYTPLNQYTGVQKQAKVTKVEKTEFEVDPDNPFLTPLPRIQIWFEYENPATGKTIERRSEPSDDPRLKPFRQGDSITIRYLPQYPALGSIDLDSDFWPRLAGSVALVLVAILLFYLGLFGRKPELEEEPGSEEPEPETSSPRLEPGSAPGSAPGAFTAEPGGSSGGNPSPHIQSVPDPVVPGPVTESEHGNSAS